ncbi:MAG: arginase [Rickettsiales bacterium]|nr:arginase [Rickettsiales bacterium]|tara:strand:+ start:25241 stop:26134 length:894 start_codon:yes stop_codon:yes gene_type:complete
MKKKIGICGIPSSLGCALPGTKNGPNALRQAGLIGQITLPHHDFGDVQEPQEYPKFNSKDNAKHLDALTAWNTALYEKVEEIINRGYAPLVLGGDHAYAMGSLGAVGHHCMKNNKDLLVIWFDAHTDFNTPETSPTGNIHGMPVRVLTGQGPAPLVNFIKDKGGFLAENIFNMIGIRSVDEGEQIAVDQSQMSVFTMADVRQQGIDQVLETIFAKVTNNTHIHFSFDIDGIDPSLAPGVGTPVEHGLSLEQTQKVFQAIKQSGRLGSMDVVELNPDTDNQDQTAKLAVELVSSLFTE